MADISIGIVASAREWRSVLQAHVRDHVAGVRVQILREPRMALELDLDVVVIDDVSSFLTRDKVVRLREKGTRVVGIYDPEGQEGLGVKFLENLGVDLTLPSNISPEEMINAVSQLKPRQSYTNTFDHVIEDFAAQDISAPSGESTLIAVSGPSGTGSTEIAIALADILVARRQATLLLDVDEVGPSVARRLGYYLHPNILSAIDTVNNVTRPLTEMVGRPSDRAAHAVHFDIIPGIANPEDWAQLRPMDMDDLFAATRKSWRYIICNTGPFAEDLAGYGIERFGATRSTLAEADSIIGVMSPTPTGYLRFLDWLASLRTLGTERPIYIVVNNMPKSSFVRGEIESQIHRDIDARFISGLFFIPSDERVVKAEWEGQRVKKGPFLTGVAEVATHVAPLNMSRSKRNSNKQTQSTSQGEYTFGETIPQHVQSQGISWNDPDVMHASSQEAGSIHSQPQSTTPQISLDNPQEFFQPSEESTQDANDNVEEVLTSSSENNWSTETTQRHTSHETYSFSPPLYAVESVNPQTETAEATQVNSTEGGYVPTFTQVEQPSGQFTSAPAEQAQPNYTQPVAAPTETPQPQGYTPHFLDKEQEDEGDENFWGN